MIASPRNMCVPGVHAYAGVGTNTIAIRTMIPIAIPRCDNIARVSLRESRTSSPSRRIRVMASDPESSPLAAQRLPEVLQLRLHCRVDRLLRAMQVILDLLLRLLEGDAIPELAAS